MTDTSRQPGPQVSQIELGQQQQEMMVAAALRGAAPRTYANGFVVAQTASDVAVVLLANAAPVGVLNLSYVSAKSLAEDLQKAVKGFEDTTHQEIKGIAEIQQAMKATNPK
jgi:hypothetical protein